MGKSRNVAVAVAAAAVQSVGVLAQRPGVGQRWSFPDCENEILAKTVACDVTAEPAARAAAVVGAMNLTEKLGNLVDNALGAPRIGLPSYAWWNEALHGLAGGSDTFAASGNNYSYATSFAMPITMAAAFDDDLIYDVADVTSTEARAFSNVGRTGLEFWTPVINPARDPRWGRSLETAGEDPYRNAQYAKAFVAGLEQQTKDGRRKVVATCKHYVAYDMERWGGVVRYGYDASIKTQDLVDYYMPPFQQCARDSNVGSIMCSYNAVNGVPVCASEYLLGTVLREHWGWTQHNNFVVSDCNAVKHIYSNFNYSDTAAQAAGVAITAGTDNICEVPNTGPLSNVTGAYAEGLLKEDVVDVALRRQLEGIIRAGYFDPPTAMYRNLTWADVNTPHARDVALRSGADGLVLKKNDGTLPLASLATNGTKVAMIGHWADNGRKMMGSYSGTPPFLHTPVWAARQLGLNVTTASGPVNQSTAGTFLAPALAAAADADVILYFGGVDQSLELEDRDRYTLYWPGGELEMISSLSSLGKPFVIVQLGNQYDDTPLFDNKNVSALLWAGYPGQDGGVAVLNTLSGVSAPAGRLPYVQYPAKFAQEASLVDQDIRPSPKNPGRTHWYYPNPVLDFGYGLHYTNFSASFSGARPPASIPIADLVSACKEKYLDRCAFPFPLNVAVSNTGSVASDFVALVFVAGDVGPKPAPIKRLSAYKRLKAVAPGASGSATLSLTLGQLARVDVDGNTVLYPGAYRVLLDVPTAAELTFELTGEPAVLDKWPTAPPRTTTLIDRTLLPSTAPAAML